MLNKRHRITKKKEIDAVFKTGKSSYNKFLGIRAVKNELGISRAAVIIGTKVSKKAVVRNRIKRRIFHVLKDRIFDLDRTYDIVVVVLPPAGDLGFDTLKKSLDENLSKLRVF